MELKFNFHIIKPIQLPWEFVSPIETGGLEYHLSPELSITFDGLVTGDQAFHCGHQLIAQDMEVNEFDAEEIFQNEILPNKSFERIKRCFKEGRNTCFFTSRQMAQLNELFEKRNFMSYEVGVYYRGKKVEDIVHLPAKEYKLIMGVFDELEVKMSIDGKLSQEEMNEVYEKSIKENAGRLGDQLKQDVKEKLKDKRFLKRLAVGFGSVIVGIGALIGRKKLSEGDGVGVAVAAVLVGAVGIVIEIFGRQELRACMRNIRMD